ncbi:MAG: F0F1 ATP synthase subunit delta [Nitrosomonas sp.]|nr:F0F1 ATP synthase subunit delta [Nitrosomonas sp.]
MAEAITIARPYAEAVFKLARESGSLFFWSETLDAVNSIVRESQIRELISNPLISSVKLREIIFSVCGKKLNEDGKRLVSLLIDNQRLLVMPQIHELFEQLKAQHESILEAEVVSAFRLILASWKSLFQFLKQNFSEKLKRK